MRVFSKSEAQMCVSQIKAFGAYCVTELINEQERNALLKELEQYEFVRRPQEVGPHRVKQDFASFAAFPENSLFVKAGKEIETLLNEGFGGIRSGETDVLSKPLAFNELVVQTYPPTPLGISPHLDGASCINLVAILVLEGDGRFCTCEDRDKKNPKAIRNLPGDLILMRGPGFLGSDARPFHFVDRIMSRRTTFGLRHRKSL